MKKPKYLEGRKAKKNFERTMGALFQVKKVEVAEQKNSKKSKD